MAPRFTLPHIPKIVWIAICMLLAYAAFAASIQLAKNDPISPPAEVTKP